MGYPFIQILKHANLLQYFLIFLPKTSTFKITDKKFERCKRIKTILESKTSIPYIAFIVYF